MFFFNLIKQYWFLALVSVFIGGFFTFLSVKFFPKIGLLDKPKKYGLKREPIPYYGGLALYFAFLLLVIVFVPLTTRVVGLLIGASLIVFVGFLDDYFDINPLVRLFVQFCASLVLVFSGVGILSIKLPFFGVLDFTSWQISGFYIFASVFTVFWLMLIVNTVNFVDGVPGLVSGISFVAGLTLFVLSVHPGVHEDPSSQVGVAMIALIVAMISLGFFVFDFGFRRILMGDTGSTFLGFLLASLAIFSGGKVATAFLVLGIPILDLFWVVGRRFLSGQKIWKGDRGHLHHRLLDARFSSRAVVLFYLVLTVIFGVLAITFVSTQQKFFMILALLLMMMFLAGSLVFIIKKR